MGIEFFESITSTNDYFKEKSYNGTLKKGDVVVAFSQSNGHGRDKRNFISTHGGIYLTVSYGQIKNEDVEKYYSLMPASSLYIRNLILDELGIKTSIKWPNDILKEGKKCIGILAERTQKNDLILGVGINYDNVVFPNELSAIATSIYVNGEKPLFTKKEMSYKIVETLLNIKTFKENPNLVEDYNNLCINIGQIVEVKTTKGFIVAKGKVQNVNDNGELILLKEDGSLYSCSSGEISICK